MKLPAFPPPDAARVVVLAPHPDDETLGCGGTIRRYADEGVPVVVVVMTDGSGVHSERSDIVALRREEARRAAEILGVQEVVFLEFVDGELQTQREALQRRLDAELSRLAPDIVFAPFPVDPHPDHVATAEAAIVARRTGGAFRIAFYEIYQPIRFNKEVDVGATMGAKRRAIEVYESGLLGSAALIAEAIEGLARYRQFFNRIERLYEVFWVVDDAPTEHEVLAWATYDFSIPRAAEVFRDKLREVDFLAREAHQTIDAQQAQLEALQRRLRRVEDERGAARDQLEAVLTSPPWRLVERFASWRDRLLPVSTRRRRFYERMMRGVKRLA
jgi:LmbE family N-acetylglucosaminyl deacetylase